MHFTERLFKRFMYEKKKKKEIDKYLEKKWPYKNTFCNIRDKC